MPVDTGETMRTRRGRALAGLATVVVSTAVAGGVAATQSSDEAALAPSEVPPARASRRASTAALEDDDREKLQQLQLLSDVQVKDADAKAGVGGVFSESGPR